MSTLVRSGQRMRDFRTRMAAVEAPLAARVRGIQPEALW